LKIIYGTHWFKSWKQGVKSIYWIVCGQFNVAWHYRILIEKKVFFVINIIN